MAYIKDDSEHKDGVRKRAAVLILVAAFAFMFLWRFLYSSPFAREWDQVDFALALDRFDLFAMQPHFPGYPYFILGGMLAHQWIEDPARALSVFNVVLTALATFPVYLLARRSLSPLFSGLGALFVQSLSYLWVISTQPMSEAAAITILWWYLWSLQLAREKNALWAQILPLFFFGVLMGTRLSLLPFGLGILLLWYYDWRRNRGDFFLRILILFNLAILFQLVWIFGLVLAEDGLSAFLQLALAFTEGHFNDWGGTVAATEDSLLDRLARLLVHHFFWIGLSGGSPVLAILMGFLCFILLYLLVLQRKIRFLYGHGWMLLLMLMYFLWALLAQNVEKPRHIAPILGMAAFLLASVLLREQNRFAGRILLPAVILLQSVHGMNLAREQATEIPATYQLAYELQRINGNFTVYTWEETRVMEYLKVPYAHKRIFTYDLFLQEIAQQPGRRIFITDHVLKGFEQQAGSLKNRVKEVARFRSNPIFDPVYHTIILYEWIPI